MRRFEFVGGTSAKFWEVSQAGTEVTVRFGRLDTNGQSQTKNLGSEAEAAEHAERLIREKLAKGYIEVIGFTAPPALSPYQVPPLPADGPANIGGVLLPAGRRLEGNSTWAPRGVEAVRSPVVWLTDGPVADAGLQLDRLRGPSARLGLVPVLLSGMESEPKRPWDSKEFSPTDPRRIDHFNAARELAHAWRGSLNEEDEESLEPVKPYGLTFPGLAVPPAIEGPTDDRAALVKLGSGRIGLVAAGRPADTITALGWMGAVNVHQDQVIISAVLRSWEERWMAHVVEIGFDTLTLTVGIPPRDDKTALALAAEHFALCPDNIFQGSETLEAYAKYLIDSRTWNFWWD